MVESGFTDSWRWAIRKELELRHGPSMAIESRRFDSIPLDPSGKFRLVLSTVGVQ